METLNKNWITENHIDFEYKKYVLLAYLQHVKKEFDESRIYPSLAELINHYSNLLAIKSNKENLAGAFPRKMTGIDGETMKVAYERLLEDDSLMKEIENIIEYSLPRFESSVKEGKEIYDYVEDKMHLFPVGVVPLHNDYGYMLLRNGAKSETRVYEYQVTLFEQPNERYRGINTQFLRSFEKNLSNTYENIKTEMLKENKTLANPATYVIESEVNVPLDETLMPIAKRLLVRMVGK